MLEFLKLENMTLKEGIYYANNIPDQVNVPEEGLETMNAIAYTSFWNKHRTDCIICTLNNFISPGLDWFADVGGGNGHIAKHLGDAGYKVVLFEPTQTGVVNARNLGVENIVRGLFDTDTVKKSSIPAVGLFDVLEHIENDEKFIRGFLPILAKKGKIIATVPAHNYLWSSKDDYGLHKRRYSLRQLRCTFIENGYNVIYETYFFSLLLPAIFLFKTLPYKLFGNAMSSPVSDVTQNEFGKEHQKHRAMELLFVYEKMLVTRKKRIPFGASVLLVAEKR